MIRKHRENKPLPSIAVTTPPTKTVYELGEALDLRGLIITATYNDGTTTTVTAGYTTDGFNSATDGTKTITVTYGGKMATFTVTIQALETAFTSIASFATWLGAQPANTAATSYTVKLNLSDLGSYNESVGNVLLANTTKYVKLDLSDSTFINLRADAFSDCPNLISVILPDSVIVIEQSSWGTGSFSRCTNLTSVTMGSNITRIGHNAFSDCTSLASITIPDSVIEIGAYVFNGCTSLTNITIPNSVTAIGKFSFFGTAWLNNQPDGVVYAGKVVCGYKGVMPVNTSITLLDGTKGIAASAFSDCTNLISITIPGSVTSIWEDTFYGCTSLANVTIGNGVTSLGFRSFSGCTSLISITIPSGVTNIWDNTFENCTSLQNVIIPNSVTSIGVSAFSGCNSLQSVTIPDSVISIGLNSFSGCSSLTGITISGSVTSIGHGAFSGCTSLTSIIIPDSVTSIGRYAFDDCTSLQSVIIGKGVTTIWIGAFSDCTSLTSVTFATNSNITSFGLEAFPEGSNGYGGDNLRNAYLAASPKAGTYTRASGGSTWTKVN